MRFNVILKSVNKKIPIGNRFMTCSLIKKAIENGDKNQYKEIYFYKDKKNKKIKDFTFSIYLNNFHIEKGYIQVNGDILITISTPNYNLGIAMYNGFLKIKEFTFKEYKLNVYKITLLKEPKINSNNIICRSLSPIYLKDKNSDSVDVQSDKFEEALNYISNIYLETYRGKGLKEKLKFIPISMKKVVIKEEIEGFKKETGKSFIFLNSYKGIFNLEGNKEDLEILLKAGLGYRRSEGFGLLDLV